MKRLPLLIGSLVLIALLFLGGRAIANSRSPQQQQIDALQQQAAGADPAAAALLQQKAAPLSAAEAAQATAQAAAPDKSGELCGLAPAAGGTPLPTVEVPRGISDWLQPPFSTQDVSVANQWNEQSDGIWLSAYAGALGQDPAQGVIIAVDRAGNYFRFVLPSVGAARFTAADGLTESFLFLLSNGAKPIKHLVRPNDNLPFVLPAIVDVTGVKDRPDVELFGPLLQVFRADDFESAIAEANNTRFGLSASLIGGSPQDLSLIHISEPTRPY
jgi:hypothetical protein